jgi:hypothetical protein
VPPYSPVEVASSSFNAQSEPGAGFGVGGTPNASVTPAGGTAVGAGFGVAVFPVTINIPGASVDSTGVAQVQDGQLCDATISPVPDCTFSNYQWSVGAQDTIQTWQPTTPYVFPFQLPNSQASYLVKGPGTLTNPNTSWYWCVATAKSETVTCTFQVTPDPGFGSPFSMTATQKVYVNMPSGVARGTAGVNELWWDSSNNVVMLQAVGLSHPYPGGMTWTLKGTAPSWQLYDVGSFELVQIVSPNRTQVYGPPENKVWNSGMNGQTGLDTFCPYPWDQTAPVGEIETSDSPGMNIVNNYVLTATDGIPSWTILCTSRQR